ncbi:hypothetical protein BJY52DRAFT_1345525, partial [Lactarius psammicola]
GQDDVDDEQWLELIRAFGSTTDFRVAGELTTDVLCALGPTGGGHTTVLPSLRHLHVEDPSAMKGPSWDALELFVTSRLLSDRPVQVNILHQCHICRASFRQQPAMQRHLMELHAYRISCSYCGVFECTVERYGEFPKHLRIKHPRVARNDELISTQFKNFSRSQLDSLVIRHGSLRAPSIYNYPPSYSYRAMASPAPSTPTWIMTPIEIPSRPDEIPARPDEIPARPDDTPSLFRRILRTVTFANPGPDPQDII